MTFVVDNDFVYLEVLKRRQLTKNAYGNMLGYAKPEPNLQLSVTSVYIRCQSSHSTHGHFLITNKYVVGTTRELAASENLVYQEVLYQVI